MGSLLVSVRVEAEPGLDRLAGWWRAWTSTHGRLVRGSRGPGHVLAWGAVALAAAALLFSIAARDLLAQLLWSLFLLWQFFVLARSKSLTWHTCGAFFLAGALVAAPLAVLSTLLVHALVGGSPGDAWSWIGWAAVSEEALKLVPLLAFLAGTRRARTLGLADHAVLGAAIGAGFQFAEEAVRRLVTVTGGMIPGDPTAHWTLLTVLPGSFGDAQAGRVLAGHAVLTALVASGIGLARRYRRPDRYGIWLVPILLWVLTVIDHAAYNGRAILPAWLLRGHDALGAGYVAAPLLLMLLLTAVAIDYRGLNRLGASLPRLLTEHRVEPLRELRLMLAVAPAGLPGISNLLAFLTERRELGYGLLAEARHPPERAPLEVPIRLGWHRQRLGALLAGSAGALLVAPVVPVAVGAVEAGALAHLASILSARWGELGTREQLGVLLILPALLGFAGGRWSTALRESADTSPGFARREPGSPDAPVPPLPDTLDAAATRRPVPPALRWLADHSPGQMLARGAGTVLDAGLRRVPADALSRRLADDTFPRRPARIDVRRLFRGGIDHRGRVLGLHHRGSIGSRAVARLVPDTRTPPDRHGVYQATVTMRDPDTGEWVHSAAPSSFFPDGWSRMQVLDGIRDALEGAAFEGLRWEGVTRRGVRVQGLIDGDGTVRTAYPVWEGTAAGVDGA